MQSTHRIDLLENFHTGSPTHALVVTTVIAMAAMLTHLGRLRLRSVDRSFFSVLYCICLIVFLRDLRPDRISWANSLPLHICDIAGLMAAIAIQTRQRFARVILHYWGLALSSQAFLFPVLTAGPIHSDFWLYWIEHGAIVVAAVYDLTVNYYSPGWRDWRYAVLLLSAYAAVVIPLDVIFDFNYGYLGHSASAQRSVITFFGRWPDRIPTLYLIGIAMLTLLRLRVPGFLSVAHPKQRLGPPPQISLSQLR